jgi:hypothetical protein
MSKKLIEIPELHNNDYDFFDVLKGLCKVKTGEAQSQKEEKAENEKQEKQLINTSNE